MQLRKRLPYIFYMILLVPIGLASRKYDADLPYLYGTYAPDVLWATMIYFGIRFLTPDRPMKWAIIGSLVFSYLIEFSQFYHAPWIDAARETWLGGLILGFSFYGLIWFVIHWGSSWAMRLIDGRFIEIQLLIAKVLGSWVSKSRENPGRRK